MNFDDLLIEPQTKDDIKGVLKNQKYLKRTRSQRDIKSDLEEWLFGRAKVTKGDTPQIIYQKLAEEFLFIRRGENTPKDTQKQQKGQNTPEDTQKQQKKVDKNWDEEVAKLLAVLKENCIAAPIQTEPAARPIMRTLNDMQSQLKQLEYHKERSGLSHLLWTGNLIKLLRAKGKSNGDIVTILGFKSANENKFRKALSIYTLLTDSGLYKLRCLNTTRSTMAALKQLSPSRVNAFFKTHPEERHWWKEGQTEPPLVTLDGESHQCTDPRWLLGEI